MKILVIEQYPEVKLELLDYLKKDNQVFTLEDEFNTDEIEAIIVRTTKVDKKLLDSYNNLKYVLKMGVGTDNIDSKITEKRGIKIINTPGANSVSVAELVVSGILYLKRKLYIEYSGVENRNYYMGDSIFGKTVGIIGFGNIGKNVYERLLGFGIEKFLVFDPFLNKEDIANFEKVELVKDKKDIFKNSDIISFHIPLLDSTKNFMGQKEIKLLKKDVMIVNTSRGGIINENKFLEFLHENPLATFYADVWEEEPNDPKLDFLDMENVLITPHIGAMTKSAEEKMHYFKIYSL